MTRYFTHGLALMLAVGSAAVASASSESVVRDITKANDAAQLATKNYDGRALNQTLTDDFVLISSHGTEYNRAAFLADIVDKSAVWEMNKTEALAIHPYNDNCAVAIGTLHLRYRVKNKLFDRRIRFTDVWVKLNNKWRWASSQAALFPEKAKS
ncbi:MAG: hypothetical protein NVSMB31_13690 [Vulcanimicrobiaceae bacterium]